MWENGSVLKLMSPKYNSIDSFLFLKIVDINQHLIQVHIKGFVTSLVNNKAKEIEGKLYGFQ